ncbi:hypothetical protein CEXT_306601 [Caerostris extrusa]|uniref:Uncharacterized protein n=1 Tax=Caerostris extrusa TaxID=172846 RepID=A0AAV4PML5_CAEEX|nr:hypothetical protein CEXT_306601 [Caerostris extrusa]
MSCVSSNGYGCSKGKIGHSKQDGVIDWQLFKVKEKLQKLKFTNGKLFSNSERPKRRMESPEDPRITFRAKSEKG